MKHKGYKDSSGETEKRINVEDLQDLAKIGSDIFKKTVNMGIDAIKEVKEGLPKEAGQFLNARKEEVMRGLSKEAINNAISLGIEQFFSAFRKHQLDISIRIKKSDVPEKN